MKILQCNVGRRRGAQDLTTQTAMELEAQIVIVAEPNEKLTRSPTWIRDTRVDVAARSFGIPNIKKTGKGEGYIWLDLTGDITVYGCYISPNVSMEEYGKYLDALGCNIRFRRRKNVVVCGDFNAEATLWGGRRTNRRGTMLTEWFHSMDFTVANVGNKPTWYRREQFSYIDITAITEDNPWKISKWEVRDDLESLSDHHYIVYELDGSNREEVQSTTRRKGWLVKDEDWTSFENKICELAEEQWANGGKFTCSKLSATIERACDHAFARRRPPGRNQKRRPNFWWTGELANLRKEAITKRRIYTRARKRSDQEETRIEELLAEYKLSKRKFAKAISKEKENAWKKVCEDVDRDPWGDGYKIVTKRMGMQLPAALDNEEQLLEARRLFPSHPKIRWLREQWQEDEADPITEEEMVAAVKKIKSKKAAGPDNITPEMVKSVVRCCPRAILEAVNDTYRKGEFPSCWKEARLVLIPKPKKKEEEEQTYRPLCLLNVLGKLLEHLILTRLKNEVEEGEGFATNQYGFRSGRSTVDAMMEVKKVAEEASKGAYQHRKLCALVTLDVRNAFNSAPWRGIMDEIERRNLGAQTRQLIKSYLEDRKLLIGNTDEEMNITCGVPQGSVLGPFLWNLYYDQVVKTPMDYGVKIIAYADDLAIVAWANTKRTLEILLERSAKKITDKLEEKGLEIAAQKTELTILAGRRKIKSMTMKIGGTRIRSSESVKYLGVYFDRNMTFSTHLMHARLKAERRATALGRLLPNTRGAQTAKRRLHHAVIQSTMMYGAEVWSEAILKHKKNRRILDGVQRKMTLKICRAYRTAPTEALQVIGRTLPFSLVAEERRKGHRKNKEERKKIKDEMMDNWKEQWENNTNSRSKWLNRIMGNNFERWMERDFGDISYQVTQAITGHGCFGTYLVRFGVSNINGCPYCMVEADTPEHTLFGCQRWEEQRERLEEKTGRITPDNIVEKMLQGEEDWNSIKTFIDEVINIKEIEERIRQGDN